MKAAALLGLVLVVGVQAGCEDSRRSPAGFALPAGDPVAGREAFISFECVKCHWVAGDDELPTPTVSPPVPVLVGGEVRYPPTDGKLVSAIINPSHDLGPSFKQKLTTEDGKSRMPSHNHIMTVQQMIDIVSYVQSRYEKVKFRDRATGPIEK
jgi:mono/diheme cytochrome c family protein